jgi:hypothetical protein
LTVSVPESQPPPEVVVVDVCIVRPGITPTSSTKSAVDRYVLTAVVHSATVTVAVFAELLNEPVSCFDPNRAPRVIVTVAAVG